MATGWPWEIFKNPFDQSGLGRDSSLLLSRRSVVLTVRACVGFAAKLCEPTHCWAALTGYEAFTFAK